ncbi:hypothetical protein CJ20_062 [Escherichia phage CJ20]|nr:hypothetical protein CJ20_062 [Escherichia phage CJ20]
MYHSTLHMGSRNNNINRLFTFFFRIRQFEHVKVIIASFFIRFEFSVNVFLTFILLCSKHFILQSFCDSVCNSVWNHYASGQGDCTLLFKIKRTPKGPSF